MRRPRASGLVTGLRQGRGEEYHRGGHGCARPTVEASDLEVVMQYRVLGRTGFKVSALGFGTMRFKMVDDQVDQELAIAALQAGSALLSKLGQVAGQPRPAGGSSLVKLPPQT